MDDQKDKPIDLKVTSDQDSPEVSEQVKDERFFEDGEEGSLVGKTLADRYEITELIGHGGMGNVYKANHKHLNKPKAIKVLHSHLVKDKNIRARFQQEAKAQEKLRNDHLIAATDFGVTENDQLFIVMDYAPGKGLNKILKENGPIEWERLIPIIEQLCTGLSYAHRKGIVHRDIKPSNIIISKSEEDEELAQIVDFGIAKVLTSDQDRQDLTKTGEIFGSPPYMSPEQCEGESNVDKRSDIYSFGCVIYEALTGVSPFKTKSTVETLMNHITEEAPLMNKVAPKIDIPEDLEKIVCKTLARDKNDRYHTADALKDDLQKFIGGESVSSGAESLYNKKNKNPASLKKPIFIFVVITVLVQLAIYIQYELDQSENSTAVTVKEKTEEPRAKDWQTLASKYFDSGDLEKAESYARKALRANDQYSKHPKNKAALNNLLGKILLSYTDVIDAGGAYDDKMKLKPWKSKQYLLKAISLAKIIERTNPEIKKDELKYKQDLANYYIKLAKGKGDLEKAEKILKELTEATLNKNKKYLYADDSFDAPLLNLWAELYWRTNRQIEAANIEIGLDKPDIVWNGKYIVKDGLVSNSKNTIANKNLTGKWIADPRSGFNFGFDLKQKGNAVSGELNGVNHNATRSDLADITGSMSPSGITKIKFESSFDGKAKAILVGLGDYIVFKTFDFHSSENLIPTISILYKEESR